MIVSLSNFNKKEYHHDLTVVIYTNWYLKIIKYDWSFKFDHFSYVDWNRYRAYRQSRKNKRTSGGEGRHSTAAAEVDFLRKTNVCYWIFFPTITILFWNANIFLIYLQERWKNCARLQSSRRFSFAFSTCSARRIVRHNYYIRRSQFKKKWQTPQWS